MKAIEDVSQKHGMWIRSPYPAARPTIAIGTGDESGYDIRPTEDGVAFTVD